MLPMTQQIKGSIPRCRNIFSFHACFPIFDKFLEMHDYHLLSILVTFVIFLLLELANWRFACVSNCHKYFIPIVVCFSFVTNM